MSNMRQRQVTIELLRVVAMMMVLALHANFIAIGKPSDSTIFSCQGITQTIAQSLCICAVNTFVMISGWFGITPRIQGFANFMWQVFYFVFLSYIVFYLFDNIPISSKDVMSCFGLFSGGGLVCFLIHRTSHIVPGAQYVRAHIYRKGIERIFGSILSF